MWRWCRGWFLWKPAFLHRCRFFSILICMVFIMFAIISPLIHAAILFYTPPPPGSFNIDVHFWFHSCLVWNDRKADHANHAAEKLLNLSSWWPEKTLLVFKGTLGIVLIVFPLLCPWDKPIIGTSIANPIRLLLSISRSSNQSATSTGLKRSKIFWMSAVYAFAVSLTWHRGAAHKSYFVILLLWSRYWFKGSFFNAPNRKSF